MRTLRANLMQILTPERLQAAGPADLIDDILKAIAEYVRTVEEIECMLLELLPDSEFSIKRTPTENCELIYSVRKQ